MNDPIPPQHRITPDWRGISADGLAEHRAAADHTRLDAAALILLTDTLRSTLDAATDGDLDRAAAGLGALLSRLPYAHPLAVAARAGLEVGALRRQHQRAHRDVSHAIAGGVPRGWAERHVPHDEIQRRRAQPGPLATDRGDAA